MLYGGRVLSRIFGLHWSNTCASPAKQVRCKLLPELPVHERVDDRIDATAGHAEALEVELDAIERVTRHTSDMASVHYGVQNHDRAPTKHEGKHDD